jgi:pimeloyl-ACP methyl ester carboxylesterase
MEHERWQKLMIDVGNGPPLVLIPGMQGRWEWARPTVEALARTFRVLSFSLAGDPGSGSQIDPRLGFDSFVVQVDQALETAGVDTATICGISYGGLIAYRYATLRPERTRHLVLASALPPDYEPDHRFRFYERAPRLLFPIFIVGSARRVSPEIRQALPRWTDRARGAVAQGFRVLGAPASPTRMCERMRLLEQVDFGTRTRITAPTLVLTGERALDRTVPVDLTERYLNLIPGAERAWLPRTGHMGTVTRPDEFARLVHEFVARHEDPMNHLNARMAG